MARQCYKLNLNGEEYKLRLTMAGQKALVERFPGENILGIIMGASDDLDSMEALLTEALNWEGNNNKIHSGAALYDELVDAGYCGTEDFMKICLNIAKNAGIINQDNRDKLERVIGTALTSQMDLLLNQLENGLAQAEKDAEAADDPLAPETAAAEMATL